MAKDDDQALTKGEFRAFKNDLNTKFSAIDKRFDVIDQRFSNIDQRFSDIDQRFDDVARMIHDLTTEVKMSFASYQRHDEKITDHERRVSALEAHA